MLESLPSCYFSVRIRNCDLANNLQIQLESYGIKVFNPCSITPLDAKPEDIPTEIANACYQMMDSSNCTVLLAGDGSNFGRDCSAELGYTLSARKPVFIFISERGVNTGRKQILTVLPIHGADFAESCFTENIEDLVQLVKSVSVQSQDH